MDFVQSLEACFDSQLHGESCLGFPAFLQLQPTHGKAYRALGEQLLTSEQGSTDVCGYPFTTTEIRSRTESKEMNKLILLGDWNEPGPGTSRKLVRMGLCESFLCCPHRAEHEGTYSYRAARTS